MIWKLIFVIILSSFKVYARFNEYASTTKAYDIQVPGSTPIRIIEGGPNWGRNFEDATIGIESNYYSEPFTTSRAKSSLNNPQEEMENKSAEDTAQALREFLNIYAENVKKQKGRETPEEHLESVPLITKREGEVRNRLASLYLDNIETDIPEENKSKSWDLLHMQRHNHPFDDRRGWVSLEAVPWSISKVSKWQNKGERPGTGHENEFDRNYNNQKANKPNYKYKPTINYPIYEQNERPATYFAQKVHIHNQAYKSAPKPPLSKRPANNHHKHDENCNHEIITDGLPSNFPSEHQESNRRRGTSNEFLPERHPFKSDGDWVLLSTTKGYKRPKIHGRSMKEDNNSVSTHRSVRLTVLPPLKNSKVNMTTSHGGLLQVESTFQTVEQARRSYLKKQKSKNKPIKKPLRKIKPKYATSKSLISNVTARPSNVPDTSAVLAAVGAGMIPATMAMLVPIAMGKRRKRNTRSQQNVEITIPRTL